MKTKDSSKNKLSDVQKSTDLQFLEKKIDFGSAPQDTILFARFHFINTGNNNLYIKSVDPDCTCTGYYINKNGIPPGDTAYIQLEYNTKNKYDDQKVYAIVEANTNIKMYKLTLKANIY